ncbi:F-box only protein 22 [Melipona quadrifasciata]|uniref:F-box only protein 22 n=1 Tax=Melipona quadrifasciata TaxID=166423 RepID=A0A0N0BGU4_9HYME|nr:F-box only protein 22 [Melipona quadrifasciata]
MENLPTKRSYEEDNNTPNVNERKKHNSDRYLTYDILRIVFKYLNWIDLSNASMVCRSWLEVANDEKRTRGGPVCLINWGKKYLKVIEKLRNKPTLGLVFKAPHKRNVRQDCLCQILPQSCEIVTLGTCALAKHGTNISKCLLLFCNQAGRALAREAAGVLQLCNATVRPAVWGGVVKDLYVCNSKNPTHDEKCVTFAYCIGITIVGAVDSWSIVMDDDCNTKELVEQKLESFKNHISLRKHSMGFMFACCERGTNMFNERDVETTIFKKLFPEVPLVGCFGDGEFGETTIQSTNFNDTKEYWYHERSTVFLIITYG